MSQRTMLLVGLLAVVGIVMLLIPGVGLFGVLAVSLAVIVGIAALIGRTIYPGEDTTPDANPSSRRGPDERAR